MSGPIETVVTTFCMDCSWTDPDNTEARPKRHTNETGHTTVTRTTPKPKEQP